MPCVPWLLSPDVRAPRVLLLTGTAPQAASVGGVILRDLCALYPPGRLACFLVGTPPRSGGEPGLPWAHATAGDEGFVTRHAWWHGLRRAAEVVRVRHRGFRRVRSAVLRYAQRQRIDLVWAVLNSPALYHVAAGLGRLGVPLVTTVWDPPEGVLPAYQLGPWGWRRALEDFARALRCCKRCAVVSSAMAAAYAETYGTATLVLPHAIRPDDRAPADVEPRRPDRLLIGFCGTPYAQREWRALLAGLDEAGWTIGGRAVAIRVLGTGIASETRGPARIEYLGWRPADEIIRLLAEADVLYLPYWFDPAWRASVRLCLPTKFVTYLAAGRPVLYHGPADAAVMQLIRRYPVGLGCHDPAPAAVIAALRALAARTADAERCDATARAAEELLAAEFSPAVRRVRFAALLGIDAAELVPEPSAGIGGSGDRGREGARESRFDRTRENRPGAVLERPACAG